MPPAGAPPAITCPPPPAFPQLANEPVITAGPTEIVTGLYLDGGPADPSCPPGAGGSSPGPGTVTLVLPGSTQVVATATVAAGQLAVIPVTPGTYTIQATFGDATINGQPGQGFPQTVTVAAGQTVRQDVSISIP